MLDGEALIRDCLSSSGSCWVSYRQIQEFTEKFGGRAEDIHPCVKAGKVVARKGFYTLPEIDKMESGVAEKVLEMKYYNVPDPFPEKKIRALVDEFERTKNEGRKLHEGQVNAVITMCNSKFCVITGGPGTGKTTVLTCAAYCMRSLRKDVSIVFTAPTGKAARRVAESSGENACTVHKKFGLGFDDQKGADRFFEDVLIIDESSMNDLKLSSQIFSAIPNGRRVVWVGDTDQLPSVGEGAVLRDLIASGVVPVAKLTKTFRQNNDSTLFTNIVNVREGRPELVEGPDFHALRMADGAPDDEIVAEIMRQFSYGVKKYGVEQTVVLVPLRKSGLMKNGKRNLFCSDKLSNILQRIANGKEKKFFYHRTAEPGDPGEAEAPGKGTYNDRLFKPGDMVMQLKNRKECANGDVGRVLDVNQAGVVAKFDGGVVKYKRSELDQLALAYSMTVNKSQGSEYKFVVMVLLNCHTTMLNRNILYTGITRAKAECSVIYQQDALEKSVKTIADAGRVTLLKEKLLWLNEKYRYIMKTNSRRAA